MPEVCLCTAEEAVGGGLWRWEKERAARLCVERFPVGGYLAGDGPALVAVGPLKQHIEHEVEAKNAKGQKYSERHRFHARTGEVLPPLETGSGREL